MLNLTPNQEFKLNCGEILRSALVIEEHLDFFFENYFVKNPYYYKMNLFGDLFLKGSQGLNFELKIQAFQKICEVEKIDKIEVSKYFNVKPRPPDCNLNEIIQAIRYIQGVRNKIAHHEAFLQNPEGKYFLQTRKSFKPASDRIEINNKLVEEIKDKTAFAYKGITTIYFLLLKKG